MKRVSVVLIALIAAAAMIVATRAQVNDAPSTEEAIDAAVADHMEAASDAFKAKDYESSLAEYTAVMSAYSDHPRARRAAVNIGYVLTKLERYDDAGEAFRAAVEAYPGTEYAAEAQTRLGYIALAKRTVSEDPDEREELRYDAAEEFAEVIRHYSDYPRHASEAHAQYAGIFFEWGLTGHFTMDEVRDVCRQVLDYFPDGSMESLATAQLMLSEIYLGQRRYELALETAATAVEQYPKAKTQIAYAHWVAGQALERLYRFEEAMQWYLGVVHGDFTPRDNFRGRNIHRMCALRTAFCLKELGRNGEASEWFRYVEETWPKNGAARMAAYYAALLGG